MFFCGFLISLPAPAQFVSHGVITYQRQYNLQRAIRWEDSYKWARAYSKQAPKAISTTFTLSFDSLRSDYVFQKDTAKEAGDNEDNWLVNYVSNKDVANTNQVLSDFKTGKQESLKHIYQKHFFITDSLVHFKWKIEDEIRMIAGYPCRKAVTTICDSVVVVAFYSDQILASGGPEGFNGLPGMILGLAIPRLYTTWFATKVSIQKPMFPLPELPKRTIKLNRSEFNDELKKDMNDWGNYAARILWLSHL